MRAHPIYAVFVTCLLASCTNAPHARRLVSGAHEVDVAVTVVCRVLNALSDVDILHVAIKGADQAAVLQHCPPPSGKYVVRLGGKCAIQSGRLIDEQSGSPCSSIVFVVSDSSTTAATVRVTYEGSFGEISITKYSLAKENSVWVI